MRKDFKLPRIYPITDRSISGLQHSVQVQMLADGGAALIQIRDKVASAQELFHEIKECMEVARANGATLIVNDRVDIALKADGVHLGQDDLPPDMARAILGPDAIIGFSTHRLAQAIEACELPVDYIAIGPVFPTNTKSDHDAPVGIEGVEMVKKAIGNIPLVAIGGIGSEDIDKVLSAGADSVALVSALLSQSGQIAKNTRSAFKIASELDGC